jgi:hypothetical protein
MTKFDGLLKSQEKLFCVITAKAGIQEYQGLLDPGVRRGDGFRDLLRDRKSSMLNDQCSYE